MCFDSNIILVLSMKSYGSYVFIQFIFKYKKKESQQEFHFSMFIYVFINYDSFMLKMIKLKEIMRFFLHWFDKAEFYRFYNSRIITYIYK